MIPVDGDDYTWTEPHTPQPAYTTEVKGTTYAYTIRGETITAEPCAPCTHIYDVATFPERLDADIAALRAELATLRAVVTDMVDTVDGLVNLATLDHMETGN